MRQRTGAALPAAAMVFGLITWAVAHALTYLLFAHVHGDDMAVVHLGTLSEPAAFAAAGILATAAVARICAYVGARDSRRIGTVLETVRVGSLTTVFAPAAFVVVEFLQHLIVGDEGPPVALMVIGLVLHAATGVLTTVLWTGIEARVMGAVLLRREPNGGPARRRPVPISEIMWASPRTVTPLGVRGPPGRLRRSGRELCLV